MKALDFLTQFDSAPTPRAPAAVPLPAQTQAPTLNTQSAPGAFEHLFQQAEKQYGVPAAVLREVARQESNFNPKAVSGAGARGMMQFMPATAQQYKVNVDDPASSVDGAARYLKYLHDRYKGDWSLALGAYNAGEGRIDNVLAGKEKSPPRETIDYVNKITGRLQQAMPQQGKPQGTPVAGINPKTGDLFVNGVSISRDDRARMLQAEREGLFDRPSDAKLPPGYAALAPETLRQYIVEKHVPTSTAGKLFQAAGTNYWTNLTNAAPAALQRLVGADTAAAENEASQQRESAYSDELVRRSGVKTKFSDVNTPMDALGYVGNLAAGSAPYMIEPLVGAAAGLLAAGPGGAAAGAGGALARLATTRGLAAAAGGAAAATVPSSLGATAAQQIEETGRVDAPGYAAGAALPYAALNLLGPPGAVLAAARGVGKGVAGRVARAGAYSALGAPVEAAGEAGQEYIARRGAMTPEAMEAYKESAIGGAILGGVMSGAAGAMTRTPAPNSPVNPPPAPAPGTQGALPLEGGTAQPRFERMPDGTMYSPDSPGAIPIPGRGGVMAPFPDDTAGRQVDQMAPPAVREAMGQGTLFDQIPDSPATHGRAVVPYTPPPMEAAVQDVAQADQLAQSRIAPAEQAVTAARERLAGIDAQVKAAEEADAARIAAEEAANAPAARIQRAEQAKKDAEARTTEIDAEEAKARDIAAAREELKATDKAFRATADTAERARLTLRRKDLSAKLEKLGKAATPAVIKAKRAAVQKAIRAAESERRKAEDAAVKAARGVKGKKVAPAAGKKLQIMRRSAQKALAKAERDLDFQRRFADRTEPKQDLPPGVNSVAELRALENSIDEVGLGTAQQAAPDRAPFNPRNTATLTGAARREILSAISKLGVRANALQNMEANLASGNPYRSVKNGERSENLTVKGEKGAKLGAPLRIKNDWEAYQRGVYELQLAFKALADKHGTDTVDKAFGELKTEMKATERVVDEETDETAVGETNEQIAVSRYWRQFREQVSGKTGMARIGAGTYDTARKSFEGVASPVPIKQVVKGYQLFGKGTEHKGAVALAMFIRQQGNSMLSRVLATRISRVLRELESRAGIKFKVVVDENADAFETGEYGHYDASTHTIYLTKQGQRQETVVHELLHAALAGLVETNASVRAQFDPIINAIQKAVDKRGGIDAFAEQEVKFALRDVLGKDNKVAVSELISWGMTNAKFQDFLKTIPMLGTKKLSAFKTVSDYFVNIIRHILGLHGTKNSAMLELIDATNSTFDTFEEGRTRSVGKKTYTQSIGASPADLEADLREKFPGLEVAFEEHPSGIVEMLDFGFPDSEQRGKGSGPAAGREIASWADRNQRSMMLTAQPNRGSMMPLEKLVGIYESFGFVRGEEQPYENAVLMYRDPQGGTNEGTDQQTGTDGSADQVRAEGVRGEGDEAEGNRVYRQTTSAVDPWQLSQQLKQERARLRAVPLDVLSTETRQEREAYMRDLDERIAELEAEARKGSAHRLSTIETEELEKSVVQQRGSYSALSAVDGVFKFLFQKAGWSRIADKVIPALTRASNMLEQKIPGYSTMLAYTTDQSERDAPGLNTADRRARREVSRAQELSQSFYGFVNDLRTKRPEEVAILSEIMLDPTTYDALSGKLTPETKEQLDTLRAEIKRYRQLLADFGSLPQAVVDQDPYDIVEMLGDRMDKYQKEGGLPISKGIHGAALRPNGFNEKVDRGVVARGGMDSKYIRVETHSGDSIEHTFVPAGTVLEADQFTDGLLWEVDKAQTLRNGGKGTAILRRKFTPEERTRFEQITDPAYNAMVTLHLLARDVANSQLFAWVNDVGTADHDNRIAYDSAEAVQAANPDAGEIIEKPSRKAYARGTWVKVPETMIPGTGTRKFGVLAGKYVPASVWTDLDGRTSDLSYIPKSYQDLMRIYKLSKTAWSPRTQFANALGNVFMAYFNDIPVSTVLEAANIMLLNRDTPESKKLLDQFHMDGADLGSWQQVEIRSELQQLLREAMVKNAPETPQNHFKIGMKLSALAGSAWKGAGTLNEKSQALYQLTDNVYRLAGYIHGIRQGMTREQAGKFAQDAFLNYHTTAPAIVAARATFMPFIMWPYRMLPAMLKMAIYKPWKYTTMIAMAQAANTLGYMVVGGDEDEERKYLREEQRGRMWAGPQKLIRMPFGDSVFLDVRNYVPLGDLFAKSEMGIAGVPAYQSMTPSGPAMLLIEAMSNRNFYTGKDISAPTDTNFEGFRKRMVEKLILGFAPNLPGVPGNPQTERVMQLWEGRKSVIGNETNDLLKFFYFAGLNFVEQAPAEGQALQALHLKSIKREYDTAISKLVREEGRKGTPDYEALVEQRRELIDRMLEKMAKVKGE